MVFRFHRVSFSPRVYMCIYVCVCVSSLCKKGEMGGREGETIRTENGDRMWSGVSVLAWKETYIYRHSTHSDRNEHSLFRATRACRILFLRRPASVLNSDVP